MVKKSNYKLGDVFEIEIENGRKGIGRILKIDEPTVFIELFKVNPKTCFIYNFEEIVNSPVLLSIWTTDIGLKKKIWNIVSNIPIEGEVVMPEFWKRDAINRDKYFIIRGNNTVEITKGQIGNAQPFGIFGHDAVRLKYIHELKLNGLI